MGPFMPKDPECTLAFCMLKSWNSILDAQNVCACILRVENVLGLAALVAMVVVVVMVAMTPNMAARPRR